MYSQPQSSISQYIPGYVVKSDYLPTRVVEGQNAQTSELVSLHLIQLRRYEEEKRRGRVFTQRPAEFDPHRYASYKVYENVQINQPLNEEHFSRVARR